MSDLFDTLVDTDPLALRDLARSLEREVQLLRRGLQQIAEGDYPADALNGETWANEILQRLDSVNWETA